MNNKELVARMRRGGWPQLSERKFYGLLDNLEQSEAEKERLQAELRVALDILEHYGHIDVYRDEIRRRGLIEKPS